MKMQSALESNNLLNEWIDGYRKNCYQSSDYYSAPDSSRKLHSTYVRRQEAIVIDGKTGQQLMRQTKKFHKP